MVGHSNLGLADAIRRREEAGELTYIGIRHEGAAAFAASAYGKLTGRPAACLTIAGPGATNLLTGLWDAKVDRAPVLALTGQVDSQVLGPGSLPGGRPRRRVRRGCRLEPDGPAVEPSTSELANAGLQERHRRARRRAPDLPRRGADDPGARGARRRRARGDGSPQRRYHRRRRTWPVGTSSVLAAAKRPVIIVGYGARDSMAAGDRRSPSSSSAPVITTFKAKGQIPRRPPAGRGVLGRSGTPVASWVMNEADLLHRARSVVLQPHRDLPRPPDRPGRLRPDAARQVPPGRRSRSGARSGGPVERLRQELGDRELVATDQRGDVADRRAIWAAEKAEPGGRRPRPRRSTRPRSSRR